MKQLLHVCLIMLCMPCGSAWAQQRTDILTLPEVQEWAAAYFPLLQQKTLAKQAALATRGNAGNHFLPQVQLSGQAGWQNAVTEVPFSMPGVAVEPLSRDQYRLALELSQLVYDGGQAKQQLLLADLQAMVREAEVNVALQQLKEKINHIYLSILLIDVQLQLNQLMTADLEAGIAKVSAQVALGTSYRSQLALLQSEKLKALQKETALQAEREGWVNILGVWTNRQLAPEIILEKPAVPTRQLTADIARPELALFHMRDSLVQAQTKLLDRRLQPRVNLFANGGYGRPGLNMLKNTFAPFIIAGVRFQWNLGGFYNHKNDRMLADISRKEIALSEEHFLLQTKAELTRQQAQITILEKLLQTDAAIVSLKKLVKDAALAQLENGVILAADYLREVHAEDAARQQKQLHELQLLQALLTYNTTAGN